MIYSIRDFTCSPNILTPSGGAVALSFLLRSSGSPTHFRARYWIDAGEPFVFSPTGGRATKEIFYPSKTGKEPAPTSRTPIGPVRTIIAPEGAPNQAHPQPLKVNLEVTGISSGESDETRELDCLITVDTLSMALGLISTGLGVSAKRIAQILGNRVSESTIQKVLNGGSSKKLIDELRQIP